MSGSSDPSWAQQDKRRVLFLDVAVQNIEHAQQFYEQHLGMRLWRRLGDLQQGEFTGVCGYGKTACNSHASETHLHVQELVSTAHVCLYHLEGVLELHH